MAEKELFEGLPEVASAAVEQGGGRPRMREPERRQVELRVVNLDSLLSADHAAGDLAVCRRVGSERAGRDDRGARAHTGPGAGKPAAAAGLVALCDEPGGGQRARSGAAVHQPRRVEGRQPPGQPPHCPHLEAGAASRSCPGLCLRQSGQLAPGAAEAGQASRQPHARATSKAISPSPWPRSRPAIGARPKPRCRPICMIGRRRVSAR